MHAGTSAHTQHLSTIACSCARPPPPRPPPPPTPQGALRGGCGRQEVGRAALCQRSAGGQGARGEEEGLLRGYYMWRGGRLAGRGASALAEGRPAGPMPQCTRVTPGQPPYPLANARRRRRRSTRSTCAGRLPAAAITWLLCTYIIARACCTVCSLPYAASRQPPSSSCRVRVRACAGVHGACGGRAQRGGHQGHAQGVGRGRGGGLLQEGAAGRARRAGGGGSGKPAAACALGSAWFAARTWCGACHWDAGNGGVGTNGGLVSVQAVGGCAWMYQ